MYKGKKPLDTIHGNKKIAISMSKTNFMLNKKALIVSQDYRFWACLRF